MAKWCWIMVFAISLFQSTLSLFAGEGLALQVPDGVEALQPPKWTWGGWLDLRYLEKPYPGAESFFNFSQVYLYSGYRFNKTWSLFGEVEYENLPKSAISEKEEFELERAYLEYWRSSKFRVRLGRFNTQAGIVKPLHWAITVDTINLPIMEANSYVPSKSNGLEVFGTLVGTRGEWQYSVATSLSNSEIDSRDPIDEATGAGVDLSYLQPNRFRIGGSFFAFDHPHDENAFVRTLLPYGEWWVVPNRLLLRGEFLHLQRESLPDLKAYYGKLKWQFHPKAYLNYRFDKGDDLRFESQGPHLQQTLTAAFRPKNHWRFKLEYSDHQFKEGGTADYQEWSAWTGFVFP